MYIKPTSTIIFNIRLAIQIKITLQLYSTEVSQWFKEENYGSPLLPQPL